MIRMYKFCAKQVFECTFALEASADLDSGLIGIEIGRRCFTPEFCS